MSARLPLCHEQQRNTELFASRFLVVAPFLAGGGYWGFPRALMKRVGSFRRFRTRPAGHHVRLHDGPMPPLLDSNSPSASEPYGSLLDTLLSEQATLTQIMKGFDQQLEAGADGESLLCSSSFQEALARLGAAQQQQRELLSVARERVVRDYPMLLEASRTLLELLSTVTARANGELQQIVPAMTATSQTQTRGSRAGGGASSDARSDPRCV